MQGKADSYEKQPQRVWVLGTIPPPVNGMTILTAKVVNSLQYAGPTTVYNFSSSPQRTGFFSRLLRVLRSLGCLVRLICSGRSRNNRLYITANSRAGLIITALMVWIGRRLGYRVYLHHHVYNYIDTHNQWMARINRCMGSSDVHIMHCDKMVDDFRSQYPTRCRFVTVFPSVVSIEVGTPRMSTNTPFCLGLLSNLTLDKGIDLAVETFRTLYDDGAQVRLKLAGPITSPEAQIIVNDVLKSYPNAVEYIGPVYDEEKARFLRDIDVFLFPTQYEEESWGIVLNEALAAGAPAITYNRGCTETVVGSQAGLVISREDNYVNSAAGQIQQWLDNPQQYVTASHAAIQQAEYLHEQARLHLQQFVGHMHSPCDEGTHYGV